MNPVLVLLIVVGVVALIILVFVIGVYNRFVGVRQQLRESWSGVEVELKRRYDLIPNLVATVKGYAAHERETLERVVALRNQAAANTGPVASQARDETELIGALKQLAVVIERYPDLKADTQFSQLQSQLAETEDRIASARRFYNGNTRELNTLIEQFPSSLIAGVFHFERADFFEIEDGAERQAPAVSL